MINVERTSTPADVVQAGDMLAWLRLNDQGENTLLNEVAAAAVERFEDDTSRPILTCTFRQYLGSWPRDRAIVLGRGGITAVGSVTRNLAAGTEVVTGWLADLFTTPRAVVLASVPAQITNASGVPISPVGYVDFTAGWPNVAAIPKAVLVAVKSLAAHWYYNREAYTEKRLDQLEQGWQRVVDRHKLGLFGPWGQQ